MRLLLQGGLLKDKRILEGSEKTKRVEMIPDEVLQECGRQRPDVLLIFGANQQDAPNVRSIIDTVNTVGAHPSMKIVVGGGVFTRTQELTGVSLGEQIGAHAEINNPEDLVEGLEVFYGEESAVKVA